MFFEVPLDGIVAGKLRRYARDRKLFSKHEFPKWKSIKALDAANSEKYQTIAQVMAVNSGFRGDGLTFHCGSRLARLRCDSQNLTLHTVLSDEAATVRQTPAR
jgi:hypothetical protein